MSNSMVHRSFIFYIKLVGIYTKTGFLHIESSGNNPLEIIPMYLEFTIFPMLVIFLNIFISSSLFYVSVLSLGLLIGGIFHLCFSMNIYRLYLSTKSVVYLCNQQVLGGQKIFSETTQSILHKTLLSDFHN